MIDNADASFYNATVTTEIAQRADFTEIRYAQCWEDADVLLAGLDAQPGDVCLSIASAGDNALALLTRSPSRVIAVDLNPAQLACLGLRVAAYRCLEHGELLELIGSVDSGRRDQLYRRCRAAMADDTRAFWDARPASIAAGIGGAGKFERYFALFRDRVMPLVHSRETIRRLLEGGSAEECRRFHDEMWDTWRWRLMFRLFFSRRVMGRLGRDPSFFDYVEVKVSDRILARTRHALADLNPAENPYLQWILAGRHLTAWPVALRAENFDLIRAHLDRLEWRCCSLEQALTDLGAKSVDRFNLSDIFEYMSADASEKLLERLAHAGRGGGRLLYWNMLARRHRPERLADRLCPLDDVAKRLHEEDKAFFYRALVIEQVTP
jgi:S-adenosylmethionine-diacylglycerol 3-amino-3-carboxypropyl transferase